ncbi:hypothetical protein B0H14DRAFT_3453805 [Mycena olivaceomarginata]|nr:hypothetical protein B0H14DRAFT_3453805 [Mycena olivaceomarginata]
MSSLTTQGPLVDNDISGKDPDEPSSPKSGAVAQDVAGFPGRLPARFSHAENERFPPAVSPSLTQSIIPHGFVDDARPYAVR